MTAYGSSQLPQRLGRLGRLLTKESALAYLDERWLKQCVRLCVPATDTNIVKLGTQGAHDIVWGLSGGWVGGICT